MSVVGKILVFVVLFLSLVWTALTVNAYVTRTNWKNALDATAKKLDEAALSANNQKKYADDQKAAADVAIDQLGRELGRVRQQLTAVNQQLADARQQLAQKLAAQDAQETPERLLQNEVAKLQNQVDLLQKSQSAVEQKANDAVIAAEKAKDSQLQAEIDRDPAVRRANDLEGKLLRSTEQRAGGLAARTPQVDEGFRATVEQVSGNLVTINLGANAKLQRGAFLSVSRTRPEPRYVGQLEIIQVEPFTAVGRFHPKAGVRNPGGDDLPRPGDTVSVIR